MEQNRIQVILTINTDNLPDNFQEIVKHEQEMIAKWLSNPKSSGKSIGLHGNPGIGKTLIAKWFEENCLTD